MPTPTEARWIMATSLAPSPMASVTAPVPVDTISTICERHRVVLTLGPGDEAATRPNGKGHLGFLDGRDAAADDDLAGQAEVEEVLLEVAAGGVGERLAVHDERHVVLLAQPVAELARVAHDQLAGALREAAVSGRRGGAGGPARHSRPGCSR